MTLYACLLGPSVAKTELEFLVMNTFYCFYRGFLNAILTLSAGRTLSLWPDFFRPGSLGHTGAHASAFTAGNQFASWSNWSLLHSAGVCQVPNIYCVTSVLLYFVCLYLCLIYIYSYFCMFMRHFLFCIVFIFFLSPNDPWILCLPL